MNGLVSPYAAALAWTDRFARFLLPTLARFIFAAVLLVYYWNSGLTKLGDGIKGLLSPTFNAFAQIFPKGAAAVGYDITQATSFQKFVTLAGTWAEFVLPALIVAGLLTRLAAFGMIGFVVVQSLTDIWGHDADAGTVGSWFDISSGAPILDQRAFWVFLLLYLAMRGAGPISFDALLSGFLDRGGVGNVEPDSSPLDSRNLYSGTERQVTPSIDAESPDDIGAGAPRLPPARRPTVTAEP